jgi:hypothetical protein
MPLPWLSPCAEVNRRPGSGSTSTTALLQVAAKHPHIIRENIAA